jgi:hypothetical protein
MPSKFTKVVWGRTLYQKAVRLLAATDVWFEAHPDGEDDQFLLVVDQSKARTLTKLIAEAEQLPDDVAPVVPKSSPFAPPAPTASDGEFAKLFGSGRDQVLAILEANMDDGGSGIQFWFDPKHPMLAPCKITVGYDDDRLDDEENYRRAEEAFRNTTEADANRVAADGRASMHKLISEAESKEGAS